MFDTFSNDLAILGQALETAWAAERAAPFGDPADAAATVTRVIADQIAALPARSVADLIVKARGWHGTTMETSTRSAVTGQANTSPWTACSSRPS